MNSLINSPSSPTVASGLRPFSTNRHISTDSLRVCDQLMVFFAEALVVGARLVIHFVVTMRNNERKLSIVFIDLRHEVKEKNRLAAPI